MWKIEFLFILNCFIVFLFFLLMLIIITQALDSFSIMRQYRIGVDFLGDAGVTRGHLLPTNILHLPKKAFQLKK
jgi:hypothetical protein